MALPRGRAEPRAGAGGGQRKEATRPGMKESGSPQTLLGSERREEGGRGGGGNERARASEENHLLPWSPRPPLAPSHEQSPGHALQHQIGLIRSGQGGQRPARRRPGAAPLPSRASLGGARPCPWLSGTAALTQHFRPFPAFVGTSRCP